MSFYAPDIEAVITFLRTEDGGKTRPVYSGYRPQFYYDGEDWDAEHTYSWCRTGESWRHCDC